MAKATRQILALSLQAELASALALDNLLERLSEAMKQQEIKFRAWDIGLREILPVEEIRWKNEKIYEVVYEGGHCRRGEDVVNCTLMQFTGLLDKNGKEIYESDIVKYKTYFEKDEVLKEVEWSDGITGFDPFADYDADCDIYVRGKDVEVIGNIYENPELMKS